jgi:hypothetical protein
MNRKQIFKAILFGAIVLWLLVHVTYAIRTNGDVKDRFVGFYSEKKNTVDAVIIGSSPVYPCFVTPKIYGDMGITMYPLSSNMQRPVATKYLIEEALKTQSPKLFIIEMRMWTARDEDLLGNMAHTREVTDNMKYSLNRIRTINAMVDDEDDRINYYFDIFKYHSNWKTLALWSQLRTFRYEYPDDLKGYVPETEVGPKAITDAYKVTDTEPLPDEQEEYLRDLLEYIKEKDLNALFVITPYTVSEDEQKKTNYMRDIIVSEGFKFVDMNQHLEEMDFDGLTDFRDYGTHTNVDGAVKVTDWFEDYIEGNCAELFTEDHRGDSRYSSWDGAYDKWLANLEGYREEIKYNLDNKIYYVLDEE